LGVAKRGTATGTSSLRPNAAVFKPPAPVNLRQATNSAAVAEKNLRMMIERVRVKLDEHYSKDDEQVNIMIDTMMDMVEVRDMVKWGEEEKKYSRLLSMANKTDKEALGTAHSDAFARRKTAEMTSAEQWENFLKEVDDGKKDELKKLHQDMVVVINAAIDAADRVNALTMMNGGLRMSDAERAIKPKPKPKSIKKPNYRHSRYPNMDWVDLQDILEKEDDGKVDPRLKGGRRTKSTKKSTKITRKHKGIVQSGGNKGKLKKGYRYIGQKTKTGLPIIAKSKKK